MSNKSNKTTLVASRLPNKELANLDLYAKANRINRSQALLKLLRVGLKREEDIPLTKLDLAQFENSVVAKLDLTTTKNDMLAFSAGIKQAIETQYLTAIEQPKLEAKKSRLKFWQK